MRTVATVREMGGLPSGTVTFLFTDIEGSTRLWDEHGERMAGTLAQHDEFVRRCAEAFVVPLHHDVADLPGRIGEDRYNELAARGASIGLTDVLTLTRAAIDELLAGEEITLAPQHAPAHDLHVPARSEGLEPPTF